MLHVPLGSFNCSWASLSFICHDKESSSSRASISARSGRSPRLRHAWTRFNLPFYSCNLELGLERPQFPKADLGLIEGQQIRFYGLNQVVNVGQHPHEFFAKQAVFVSKALNFGVLLNLPVVHFSQ